MPLRAELEALVAERKFWLHAYWLTEDVESFSLPRDFVQWFGVTERHALALAVDDLLCRFSLGLGVDEQPTVELGWDDEAHWHPHVLRWKELDAVGRAVAEFDASLPHPGLPVLLLARFAPITDDEDARLAHELLDVAWDELGLVSTKERATIFDRLDARSSAFRWRRGERGWVIEQDPSARSPRALYTLRSDDNETFPFEELAEMLALASASDRAFR